MIGHDGAIVETATQRVGFRRFRIEDGIMKLNGKRVVFKGADRHEFDAKRGRAITRQDMIDDITFCKRHNIKRHPHLALPQPGILVRPVRRIRHLFDRRNQS